MRKMKNRIICMLLAIAFLVTAQPVLVSAKSSKPDGTGYKIYKGDKYDNCEKLCAANGKLYYGKQGEKHSYICSMKPDGSGRKILIRDADFLVTDGKRIYYQPWTMLDGDLYGKVDQKNFRCVGM